MRPRTESRRTKTTDRAMTRKHRNPPVDLNTELAFQRTRQAADRTLMAWMRTSISMISFGFSIGKLFDASSSPLSQMSGGSPAIGPFAVGALLIVLAVLFLIAASFEYQMSLRVMAEERGQRFSLSTAQVAATALSLLGLLALTSLLGRF
jgi:putative membrane protein